jgi:hypothetical protein
VSDTREFGLKSISEKTELIEDIYLLVSVRNLSTESI